MDQAACDLGESVHLMAAVKSLSRALLNYLPNPKTGAKLDPEVRNALVVAHWEAQPYKREQYTDLYDFCQLLKANCEYEDVQTACQNVMNTIRGSANEEPEAAATADTSFGEFGDDFREMPGFVLKSCYSGLTVQYSYGVSIYFPWADVPADLDDYEKLYFAGASEWAVFLRAYLSATKREARSGRGEPQSFSRSTLIDKYNVTSGSEFILLGHRNGPRLKTAPRLKRPGDKDLSNIIGSMRNPPQNL